MVVPHSKWARWKARPARNGCTILRFVLESCLKSHNRLDFFKDMARNNNGCGRQLSYWNIMLELSFWFMVDDAPAARHTPTQRLKPKSRTAVGKEHWEDHWKGEILSCLDHQRLLAETKHSKLRIMWLCMWFKTQYCSIIPALSQFSCWIKFIWKRLYPLGNTQVRL
jgi:hypothetical protein